MPSNDDTSMRILRLIREPGDKRTGTFTSGIVSLVNAWTIALFFTGRKHAGENIAEVLKQRAHELPAPIQMCDALSRNTPKGVETLIANCLAHGRRQVVEVVDHFPEECRYVLETLGGVYHNDSVSRERELSPEDRLRFHQEHSGPLMKGLHEWMEAQLAEPKTEPNSGLGKAISYLLNHWPKLTLFLRQARPRYRHRRPRCLEVQHTGVGRAPRAVARVDVPAVLRAHAQVGRVGSPAGDVGVHDQRSAGDVPHPQPVIGRSSRSAPAQPFRGSFAQYCRQPQTRKYEPQYLDTNIRKRVRTAPSIRTE